MYVGSSLDDPRHSQYGKEIDLIGLELNRRTGETKYKL